VLKRRMVVFIVFLFLLFFAVPGSALGADYDTVSNGVAIDTVWTLIAAFLVMLMHAGFTMVETGFTRAKNAGNIIMKNLMAFSVGSFLYWLVGYGIMFGTDWAGLLGTKGFALFSSAAEGGMPVWAFLLFQTVFCATAATIVSGAMAERMRFSAFIIFTAVATTIIYPVVGHWIWGGGWLANLGFKDFAGSTVVHSVGGWAALVGAAVLGPRLGKYGRDGAVNVIPGHNITLGALGVFLLWFGWFGFNAGSTVAGTDMSVALIALNTNLAAAVGSIAAMAVTWIKYGKPDVSISLNGALGGLVAVTAGCAFVNPLGAIIIGTMGGLAVATAVEFIDKKLKVDDPVGAISVHGVCGCLGTLAVGLFDVEQGLFYGGGVGLLGIQALGAAAVFLWAWITSFILFKAVNATIGLRVAQDEEELGLDLGEHGMEAYADFTMRGRDITYNPSNMSGV